jgi:DNA-binding MarR family transcriptional regulator
MTDLRETLLSLFTEVAIIEHLARTRIERKVKEGEMLDGMNARHFGILNYFIRNHHGPDSVAGIAWAFQEDESYTAGKVSELEAMGYVSVVPDGSTAPTAMVSVTDVGRDAQAKRLEEMAPEFVPLVAEISPDDLDTTARVLREIRLTLDNLPDR